MHMETVLPAMSQGDVIASAGRRRRMDGEDDAERPDDRAVRGASPLRRRPSAMTTKPVTLWLREETIALLHDETDRRGGKLSTVADALLQEGLEQRAARQLEETALPAVAAVVRQVVAEQCGYTEARLAKLLAQLLGGIALDAGVGRRIAGAHAVRALGEDGRADLEDAFDEALTTLTERGLPHPPATRAAR